MNTEWFKATIKTKSPELYYYNILEKKNYYKHRSPPIRFSQDILSTAIYSSIIQLFSRQPVDVYIPMDFSSSTSKSVASMYMHYLMFQITVKKFKQMIFKGIGDEEIY